MIKSLRKRDSSFILIAPVVWLCWLVALLITIKPHSFGLHRFLAVRWLPGYADLILGSVLIVMGAFAANRVVQNSVLLGRISNFPMLFLVVMAAFIPRSALGVDGGLILLIQVPLLRYILDLPEGHLSKSLAYNSGVIIGAMSFVEPWAILLVVVVLQAMLSTGLLDLRKFILHLLGVLTPEYLLNAGLFLADQPLLFPQFEVAFSRDWFSVIDVSHGLQLGLLLVLGLFAFFSVLQISSHSTLREKRKWYLVITYAFVAFISMLLAGFSRGYYLMLIPGCIVLARLFLNGSNKRALNFALILLFVLWVLAIFLGS